MGRVFTQTGFILFEFRVVEIFPFFADVLLVKVIFQWWHKRCSYFPLVEVLPGKVSKPRMSFDFVRSVVTQPVMRLSLHHLIYEISGFDRPFVGNIAFFDLYLFRQNVITNFLP